MKLLLLSVALVAACHAKLTKFDNQEVNKVTRGKDDDVGHMVTCDKAQNFTLEWRPKKIDLSSTKSVQATFDMISVSAWDKGEVCYSVWLPQYPDPIYQGCSPADCSKLPAPVKVFLPCPVTKGHHYHVGWTPYPLPQGLPIPPSDYKVKVELKNQDETIVFCAQGTITIDNTYDY